MNTELEAGKTPLTTDLLFAGAYAELRRLAHARLRGRAFGAALGTTSLVHESYLRCKRLGAMQASDRNSFFAYASAVMRSVIVDIARRRVALRRGSGAHHSAFDDFDHELGCEADEEIVRVHEALLSIAAVEPRISILVQMRYFAGLTEAEIGAALGIAERTVKRDWQKARLLLAAVMAG